MPLIDVTTARRELRLGSEVPDADITRKLDAAQLQVEGFLGRNVYVDLAARSAAVAAAPPLATATATFDADMATASLLEVSAQREAYERLATDTYNDAFWTWNRVMRGMVINETVKTAILLIAGGLFEHGGDEEVPAMPQAAREMLFEFRTGLGV